MIDYKPAPKKQLRPRPFFDLPSCLRIPTEGSRLKRLWAQGCALRTVE
jgi:hypothetical protein